MDILEVMRYKYFTVVGDTKNESKYAYKIKNKLIENNYIVSTVLKDESLNNINKIEVIVLCINSIFGLKLIKECNVKFDMIIIQPNADSIELLEYLNNNKIPYLQGCCLKALEIINK